MTTELLAAAKETCSDPLAFGDTGVPSQLNTLSMLSSALDAAIDTVPPSGDEVDKRDVLCKPAEPITISLDVTRRQAAIMSKRLMGLREQLLSELMSNLREGGM